MDAQRPASRQADWPFWAGVVVLAVLVRLVGLGHAPLGAAEADLAARAWDAARGLNPDPAAGGWLTSWLASVFFVTGPSAFWARLLPALTGALFPLLARAWQPVWGRAAARAVALLWAVDPALVAASRLAWGPALALALTWAAWTAYRRGRVALAGVLALAALAAGPTSGWAGLALLAILFWEPRPRTARRGWAWAGLALTLLLLTTAGLGYPAGLGGWAGGLVAWAQGWGRGDGVPPLAGALYLAPLLLWAAWGAWREPVRGSRAATGVALTVGALTAGLWLVYPARQAADLAWVSAFAAPWAAQAVLDARGRWSPAAGALAAGLVVLALFGLLTLAADGLLGTPWLLRAGLVVLALLAAGLLAVVVHGFAGPQAVRRGAGLAALVLTGLWAGLSLSHAWRAAASDEFWQHDGAAADLRALEASLTFWGDRLGRGASVDLEGVIVSPHPALRWLQASRFPRLEPRLALMPGEQPPVVLTEPDDDPGGGYRGQRYRLSEQPVLPDARAWARWFVYRQAEVQAASIILWVREDLFAAHTNAVP